MKIVVVGNGAAGNSAAFTARKLCRKADISIFSADSLPEYSPCLLPNYIAGSVSRQQVFLRSLSDYGHHRIHAFFGEKVTDIDPVAKRIISKNQVVLYDKVIIATGSKPVIPKITGTTKQGVFAPKSLQDIDVILAYPGRRVAVIGSGHIGVSIGGALRERGLAVYLIAASKHILPTAFDERPSLLISDILQKNGITVLPGEKVVEILGDKKVSGVLTNKRNIECDMVILAKGMKPDVNLAKGIGLQLGELGGIKVDKQMRTNRENIYACGDCVETDNVITGKPTLSLKWPSAKMQGMVAAHNSVGRLKNYPGSLNVAGINIFGNHAVSMGIIGSAIDNNTTEIIDRKYTSHYIRLLISNNILVGAQLINYTQYSGVLFSAIRQKSTPRMLIHFVNQKKLPIIASKLLLLG